MTKREKYFYLAGLLDGQVLGPTDGNLAPVGNLILLLTSKDKDKSATWVAVTAEIESEIKPLMADFYQEYAATRDVGPAPPEHVPGICSNCGEPIAPERLAVEPNVMRCTACRN